MELTTPAPRKRYPRFSIFLILCSTVLLAASMMKSIKLDALAYFSVDLGKSRIDFPQFEAKQTNKYEVTLLLDPKLLKQRGMSESQLRCLLGDKDEPKEGCKDTSRIFSAHWSLLTKGKVVSAGHTGGSYLQFNDDSIEKPIATFDLIEGVKYTLFISFDHELSAFSATKPMILIALDRLEYKGGVVYTQLYFMAAVFVGLWGIIGLLIFAPKGRFAKTKLERI